MHVLFWLLIFAAIAVSVTPFSDFFDDLKELNRQQTTVTNPYASPDSDRTGGDDGLVLPSLITHLRDDDDRPPPCFVHREPGLKGRMICTR